MSLALIISCLGEFLIVNYSTELNKGFVQFQMAKDKKSTTDPDDFYNFSDKSLQDDFYNQYKLLPINSESPIPSFYLIDYFGNCHLCHCLDLNITVLEALPYAFWVENLIQLDLEYEPFLSKQLQKFLKFKVVPRS